MSVMEPHFYSVVFIVDERGRHAFCDALRYRTAVLPGAVPVVIADGNISAEGREMEAALERIADMDDDTPGQIARKALAAARLRLEREPGDAWVAAFGNLPGNAREPALIDGAGI
ncbi:MAG: hypothetical protein J0H82_05895 [Alphaproteobacteria bacterium]|jgi:hypothetical protein|nr:hypothetical protein [Alphaproteobacteria bacterium]